MLDSSFRFVVLLVVVVLVGPVGCVNPRGFCDSSDCTICVASPPLEIVQCLREIDSCLRLAGITLPVLVFPVSPLRLWPFGRPTLLFLSCGPWILCRRTLLRASRFVFCLTVPGHSLYRFRYRVYSVPIRSKTFGMVVASDMSATGCNTKDYRALSLSTATENILILLRR